MGSGRLLAAIIVIDLLLPVVDRNKNHIFKDMLRHLSLSHFKWKVLKYTVVLYYVFKGHFFELLHELIIYLRLCEHDIFI